jgi:hypothetical protein
MTLAELVFIALAALTLADILLYTVIARRQVKESEA